MFPRLTAKDRQFPENRETAEGSAIVGVFRSRHRLWLVPPIPDRHVRGSAGKHRKRRPGRNPVLRALRGNEEAVPEISADKRCREPAGCRIGSPGSRPTIWFALTTGDRGPGVQIGPKTVDSGSLRIDESRLSTENRELSISVWLPFPEVDPAKPEK